MVNFRFLFFAIFQIMFIGFEFSASAINVVPDNKLGRLIVKKVSAIGLPLAPNPYNGAETRLTFYIPRVDGVEDPNPINLDREISVAAGSGCLIVYSLFPHQYRFKKCGIEIKPQKLTEITLKGFQLNWDVDKFKADVGPRPELTLTNLNANLEILDLAAIRLDDSTKNGVIFWTPETEIGYSIGHKAYGILEEHALNWNNQDFLIYTVVPEQEYRATLTLNFKESEARFPINQYNDLVVRSAVRIYEDSESLSNYIHSPGWQRKFGALNDFFYKFQNTGKTQSIKMYIYGTQPQQYTPVYYYMSINEHRVPLNLTAGSYTQVPVATINLHSLNTSGGQQRPRVRLLSNQQNTETFREVTLYGDRYKDKVEHETPTTFYFPYGYKYRFDYYLKDDLGRNSLQTSEIVDLEEYPNLTP